MSKKLLDCVAKIPKSDLHVHLDGSVRVDTIIDLYKKHKLALPSYTASGLNELVFKERYRDLHEYLECFSVVLPIMQTPEDLERISYEFAMDNINEGVSYVEIRFAPHLHVNPKQNLDAVLLSVNRGLAKAKNEYNTNFSAACRKDKAMGDYQGKEVQLSPLGEPGVHTPGEVKKLIQREEILAGRLPEFNYGIIVIAMRAFSKDTSKYFKNFLNTHKDQNLDKIAALTSLELVKNCIKIKDKHSLPIVALDLAGDEKNHPAIYHKDAYLLARRNFLHLTAHTGEASGPEEIQQTITELYPERIGHGLHLFSSEKIADPYIKNRSEYIEKLAQYMASNRITIEVCLSSNLQISGYTSLKEQPFAKMLAYGLSTVLSTDNRTVSKTSVTKELELAIKNFNLSADELKNLVMQGFKKSFYPGTYKEKLSYLRQVEASYDSAVSCDAKSCDT